MNTHDGGLSAREHSEMRDLVLAGTQRIRPAGAGRLPYIAIGVSLVLVGAVTGGVLTAGLRDAAPAPAVTAVPAPTPDASPGGWVAYSSPVFEGDIYFVRPGSPPHRVLGSDDDELDQVCPSFSPDGMRLASGQARGNEESGWQDAALVITDLGPDGKDAGSKVIPLEGQGGPPCPIWSPDGRWVAFGADLETSRLPASAGEVWVVSTETGDIRRLTGLTATDVEWASDGGELYVADEDGILVYSISEERTRILSDTAGAVALASSPDGGTLAVERGSDLWLMSTDGADRRVLVEGFTHGRGIGPVWSPDGTRIVLQRTGDTTVTHGAGEYPILGENDEIVIVTAGDDDALGPAGTQAVLPPVETTEGSEPRRWLPSTVSWAPDSTALRFIGWELLPSGDMGGGSGLLVVPVDGSGPPTILWETQEGIGTMSTVLQNDFQSWSPE